jgi:5-methylcytosine-specific restriction protein A
MSPMRAARPCSYPGCPQLVRGSGYLCQVHARERDLARGTPVERGYGAEWKRVRNAYLIAHPICCACGQPSRHVDHVVPLRRGGSNDASNLQALCASCHSRKTATVDSNFARWGGL